MGKDIYYSRLRQQAYDLDEVADENLPLVINDLKSLKKRLNIKK